jgi:hypothetical protein
LISDSEVVAEDKQKKWVFFNHFFNMKNSIPKPVIGIPIGSEAQPVEGSSKEYSVVPASQYHIPSPGNAPSTPKQSKSLSLSLSLSLPQ